MQKSPKIHNLAEFTVFFCLAQDLSNLLAILSLQSPWSAPVIISLLLLRSATSQTMKYVHWFRLAHLQLQLFCCVEHDSTQNSGLLHVSDTYDYNYDWTNSTSQILSLFHGFLSRDTLLSAVYAVVVCLSDCLCVCVCVCVCPSHSGIVSKRLNVGSRK